MKTTNVTLILVAVFLLLLIALGGAAVYYHGEYSEQVNANAQLQRDNEQQGTVIATQSFQFNRFNQIAASQLQFAVALTGRQQEKEIAYRTILKTEPTCALAVPAGVAGRLLEYANSLRASAMHADPGIADSAGSGTATAGTLTYCQAVLWIDPLLTVIEQANSQLAGVRNIEDLRLKNSLRYL
ncbi:DUF2570 domain-containing protein [Erwinia sp. Leaf53]|uniref:DUF2570 domain-containing protein n=1 Tax=Erwinia sp. Leaf53 TaxID=1736225 RepID=UPI000700B210|nr:DUF2570 domain-containing protein [Erwinia sp. Leaf53]KQN56737.1 hypothetical protein ASF13_06345 [Erwinia sp. Leaf53]